MNMEAYIYILLIMNMEANTYDSPIMGMEANTYNYTYEASGEYPLVYIIGIEVNPHVLKSKARVM